MSTTQGASDAMDYALMRQRAEAAEAERDAAQAATDAISRERDYQVRLVASLEQRLAGAAQTITELTRERDEAQRVSREHATMIDALKDELSKAVHKTEMAG